MGEPGRGPGALCSHETWPCFLPGKNFCFPKRLLLLKELTWIDIQRSFLEGARLAGHVFLLVGGWVGGLKRSHSFRSRLCYFSHNLGLASDPDLLERHCSLLASLPNGSWAPRNVQLFWVQKIWMMRFHHKWKHMHFFLETLEVWCLFSLSLHLLLRCKIVIKLFPWFLSKLFTLLAFT